MQHELLLEIGTEEIPAGFIGPALKKLQDVLTGKFAELNLQYGSVRCAATPRRLAICVEDLISRQPDSMEEIMGPPKQAAFDANNAPTKAAVGFVKSRGASVNDLEVVTTPKGEYIMLRVSRQGEKTHDLLTRLLPEIILNIPFQKSMRWGSGLITFARPVHWILALYNGKIVPFAIDGISSGDQTRGHRFMAPEARQVPDFRHYLDSLRSAQVIADIQERRAAVISEVKNAAAQVGGRVFTDDDLLDLVTNLVEKPYGICGAFEDRFLALPREVLITSMREHQKYFTVEDSNGSMMPNFVAINNTGVKNRGLTAAGHQRVLRARLEDALFFFNEDRKKTLAERVNDLAGLIFQAKLGTMLEKTQRLTELAGMLARELAPDMIEETKRAAHLAKSDLLTEMVNEFPSLQGIIGKDYALLNGETPEVATAISEHYMPTRAGGPLPQTLPGKIVSLADRLDTIAGCFGIGHQPTGTADPFGLRRLALGLLHIIEADSFQVSLKTLLNKAMIFYGGKITGNIDEAVSSALDFIKGRLVNDLNSRGIPLETIEAVTSVAFDNPTDCRLRIKALDEISAQETFTLLAGSFKRVMNIIKGFDRTNVDPKLLIEPAEQDLFQTFKRIEQETRPLLDSNDYRGAMTVILKMKDPVDTFFDKVMVMADDAGIRENRLALLASIAGLFLKIGDFSKMYALSQ